MKKTEKKEEIINSIDKEELNDINDKFVEDDIQIADVKKDGFNLLEVILIMLITLCFGALLGSSLTYAINKNDSTGTIIKSTIPDELTEFVSTYNDIVNNYYEKVDKDKLLDAGIKGMIDFLGDKYSVYMNKEQSDLFNQEIDGGYTGIGVEMSLVYKNDNKASYDIVLTKVFENSPAYNAGIKVGDKLIKLGNQDITNFAFNEVSSLIKNAPDGKVNLTIIRDGQEYEFDVVNGNIQLPSVSSEVIEKDDKKVGYIKIDIFAANTTSQFESALLKLENQGIGSLIIDVRNNSGGYLSTVTDIASMFLDKTKIIFQLDTKGIVDVTYSNTSKSRDYPIVVLINGKSASASEILAGAMLESYGAEVVGVNSYGKGTVQKAYKLESGAVVKYTVQKWLTPNGNWINEKGITPTVVIENDKDSNEDLQLNKAIEIAVSK